MMGARKPPPFCPSNTAGMGTAGKMEFSNGEQSWTEQFDLVSEVAAAFKRHSHAVTTHKTWLEHGDSGFLSSRSSLNCTCLKAAASGP